MFLRLSTLLLALLHLSSAAMTGKEEDTLSADEQKKFDALKGGIGDDVKKHPHLGNDVVLKKFLRFHKFDDAKAKAVLAENIKWDAEARNAGANVISDSAYPDWKKKIGGNVDAVDKEGRPIVYLKVTKYEWTKAQKNKEMGQWKNTFYRMLDEAAKKAIDKFAAGGTHSRYYLILDYIGWEPVSGLCALCVPDIIETSTKFDARWPNMASKVTIVMTPDTWKAILDIVKPILSHETQEALSVHGLDKKKWWPELQKDIADEELKKLPFDENPAA